MARSYTRTLLLLQLAYGKHTNQPVFGTEGISNSIHNFSTTGWGNARAGRCVALQHVQHLSTAGNPEKTNPGFDNTFYVTRGKDSRGRPRDDG